MKKWLSVALVSVIVVVGILFFVSHDSSKTLEDADRNVGLVVNNQSVAVNNSSVITTNVSSGNSSVVTGADCSDPLSFFVPVDLSLVTSILYPGQYRGVGQYKPHGGFRFDGSAPSDIVVRSPFDARIRSGSRYLGGGDLQYLFEFETSCGVRFRFDHLVGLSPKLAEVAKTFKEATEGDSRTTFVEGVFVKKNEVLASSVGFVGNVFVDFGLYDMNKKNGASKDPNWKPAEYGPQAIHGLCWLDHVVPEKDRLHIRSLPGSGGDTSSDYC